MHLIQQDEPQNLEAHWERVKANLKSELGDDVFTNWFGSAQLVTQDSNEKQIHISVATEFLQKWINDNYYSLLQRLWSASLKQHVMVHVRKRNAAPARAIVDPEAIHRPRKLDHVPADPSMYKTPERKTPRLTVNNPSVVRRVEAVSRVELEEMIRTCISMAGRITIASIERVTARLYGFSPQELRVKRGRIEHLLFAQQFGMYLASKLTKQSYTRISLHFGGYDHTSVGHAITSIENRRERDPVFNAEIEYYLALFQKHEASLPTASENGK